MSFIRWCSEKSTLNHELIHIAWKCPWSSNLCSQILYQQVHSFGIFQLLLFGQCWYKSAPTSEAQNSHNLLKKPTMKTNKNARNLPKKTMADDIKIKLKKLKIKKSLCSDSFCLRILKILRKINSQNHREVFLELTSNVMGREKRELQVCDRPSLVSSARFRCFFGFCFQVLLLDANGLEMWDRCHKRILAWVVCGT